MSFPRGAAILTLSSYQNALAVKEASVAPDALTIRLARSEIKEAPPLWPDPSVRQG
jgi:hypothetical protein